MLPLPNFRLLYLALAITWLVAACGGDDEQTTTTTTTTQPTTTTSTVATTQPQTSTGLDGIVVSQECFDAMAPVIATGVDLRQDPTPLLETRAAFVDCPTLEHMVSALYILDNDLAPDYQVPEFIFAQIRPLMSGICEDPNLVSTTACQEWAARG